MYFVASKMLNELCEEKSINLERNTKIDTAFSYGTCPSKGYSQIQDLEL